VVSVHFSDENAEMLPSLPQGWVWATLEESMKKVSDGAHFTPHYVDAGYPFIKISDVNGDEIDFSNVQYVDEQAYEYLKKNCNPQKGDVLFSKDGTVGKVIEIDYDKQFVVLSSLAIIRPHQNLTTSHYLKYLLQSSFIQNQATKSKTGTAISRIIVRNIKPIKIPISPLNEQHRIVTKTEELFTQLDAGVASLKKVQAQLKRYRQAVLKAAFEGRLTQEWREEHKGGIEPAAGLLEKYKADLKKRSNGKVKLPWPLEIDELPQLPNQWVWTKVGEFVEIIRGASPRPAGSPRYFGGNIPWITVGELTKNENIYLKTVSSYVTEEGRENSRFVKADTLLLTNSGATLGVPKITLIDGCINDGSVALLGLDVVLKLYLYFFLKSQTKRLRQINQGAAQPNLNTDIVRNIVVPFPSLEEQKEVINEIERHFSQIDHLEQTITTSVRQAEILRHSILKRAFEGKLVPQDPNDEPASILLGRIKAEKARHAAEVKKGKTLQHQSPKRTIKNGN
jgi:type I restriction enzyme S subunit